MSEQKCLCGRQKTRYEVKVKNDVKEYYVCWPCYEEYLKNTDFCSEEYKKSYEKASND
jgi:hypothetical protein